MKHSERYSIGIATTWYGSELKSGAENQARELAIRLCQAGHRIQVLTSCSDAFTGDWDADSWKPGLYQENGVDILRFPVGKRRPQTFNRIVEKLLAVSAEHLMPGFNPISKEEEAEYWQNNIHSPALLEWLEANQHLFDFVIFMPYLFPLAREGVRRLGKRALLQPCLHDEPYAYLSECQRMAAGCLGLLFNSEGEYLLARRILGPGIVRKSFVVGEGLELRGSQPLARPPAIAAQTGRKYILFLGRRCREKNTWQLLEEFAAFRQQPGGEGLNLVLAGPGEIPSGMLTPGVVDPGLVDEADKSWLLENSLALVCPGVNESFSRVLFESWHAARPVLVHGDCLATRYAVEASRGGGWVLSEKLSWQQAFYQILTGSEDELARMGRAGKSYGLKMCAWPAVLGRYEEAFSQLSAVRALLPEGRKAAGVLLILPFENPLPAWILKDLTGLISALESIFPGALELLCRKSRGGIQGKQACVTVEDCRRRSLSYWDSVLWYSDSSWPEAEGLVAELKGRKYLRPLGPFSDGAKPWLKGFDRILSPFWGGAEDAKTLPLRNLPFFGHEKVRSGLHLKDPHREGFVHEGLNIALFVAGDDHSQKVLSELLRTEPEEEGWGVHFFIPGALPGEKTVWHSSQGLLNGRCQVTGSGEVPGEYLSLCELVLVIGEPFASFPGIFKAFGFAVPLCCVFSPTLACLAGIRDFRPEMGSGSMNSGELWSCIYRCAGDQNFKDAMRRRSAEVSRRAVYRQDPAAIQELF